MRRRHVTLWSFLILLAVGCAGGEEEPAGETVNYTVRGIFARVEDDGKTMTVRHEEIPGYMASMTMPFEVQEAALLEGLEYGDKIEFELAVGTDGSVVTSIEKLPKETLLSWETPLP